MRSHEVSQTIDEAAAFGWHGLAIYCSRCRRQTVWLWPDLRSRTSDRQLATLAEKLTCHVCGERPSMVKLVADIQSGDGRTWTHEKEIEFAWGQVIRPQMG